MCAGSCEKPAKESAERGSAAAAQISDAGDGSTEILEISPRFYVEAAARRDGEPRARGMKRPLSPEQITEDVAMKSVDLCTYTSGKILSNEYLDYQLNIKKRKIGLALCEVCNIQLNSAEQAEVHYNGRSHLKRMKQVNGYTPVNSATSAIVTSASTGSTCHASTLPAFVRAPTLMMQPSLDIKSFMPFPMDTGSAVGLFPNFNTMDPVQKAVINHTFGVSAPPKKKQIISCNVCQLRFNSESQAEAHYKGSKHAKKLKALEASKHKQKTAPTNDSTKAITSSTTTTAITPNSSEKTDAVRLEFNSVTVNNVLIHTNVGTEVPQPTSVIGETGNLNAHSTKTVISMEAVNVEDTATTSTESEEEKAKKLLYCSLCKVAVNSLSQLEAHNTGSKHKTMVEARIGAGPIKSYPRPGSKAKLQNGTKGSGLQNKTFHCEICDVHVNSEIQLKQHISSRRHKDRVAGKPLKPKYSPYNKLQRNSSILAAKIAFQKDLIKPLAPGFLSNPFAAAAAMTSPLPLHARPATSLFQTTALTPALLRPAPGPIRASPGSILFAPY